MKECDTCQKVKITQPVRKGELHIIRRSRPNELITSDITGPFPLTKNGNLFILVIICAFTKFAEIYAIPNTRAPTVANKIVNEWISRYGVPEQILTDQGKNYQSNLLELVYELLDIKRLRTTPYHPQCDGQSERYIRTIKPMISSYVNEQQTDWDEHLNKRAFAYNTAVHQGTKVCPFEMRFGEYPRIPCDIIFGPKIARWDPFLNEDLVRSATGPRTILEDRGDPVSPKVSEETLE